MLAAHFLQNEKGQAMAEALMMSLFILTGSTFLLAVFINQMISIAVDDAMETYFFCQIQKKTQCYFQLDQNLNELHLVHIEISEKLSPPRYELQVRAKTQMKYKIDKRRQLFFDRNLNGL
jgi:hypothetical protein